MREPDVIPPRKLLVLLIDPDPGFGNLCRELIEGEGHHVILAAHGLEGLRQIQEEKPDVVFLDATVPGADALDLMERIHEEDSSLPVILCSVQPLRWDEFRSWAAEARLVKSADRPQLKLAIQKALSPLAQGQGEPPATTAFHAGPRRQRRLERLPSEVFLG